MIHFFRRIRQKLITDGHLSKYLVYAIGEILLVVIGILIAVQINNWNESRIDSNVRTQLITELQSELDQNITKIDSILEVADGMVQDALILLELLGEQNLNVTTDSIRRLSSFMAFGLPFDPILPSFDEAKSTGKLSLLKSKDIINGYAEILTIIKGWQLHRDISTEGWFLGHSWELRKQLGSIRVLHVDPEKLPKRLRLSDQEYRNILSLPEIYAEVENNFMLRNSSRRYLRRMKVGMENVNQLLEDVQNGKRN